MIGRKQELNLQFQQILDGGLLVVAFWASYVSRLWLPRWFDNVPNIPNFNEFKWVLFILILFGPIILEMHGFYTHVLQKDVWKSMAQLGRGALVLGILTAGTAFFFGYRLDRKSV